MPNILHLNTERTWRGGENQMRLLVEGLHTYPEFHCHAALTEGTPAAERFSGLCPVLYLKNDPVSRLRRPLLLADYCRRNNIDIIDAHTSKAHTLAVLVRRLCPQVRVIVHRRVDYPPGRSLLNRRKYLSDDISRYVAISNAIKLILINYGIHPERITVVRSAVPLPPQLSDAERRDLKVMLGSTFNIDPSLPFIGNASALTAQKGHETLLRALHILKSRGMKFHAFIAGDGDLAVPLEKLRAALGLEYDVTMLGFIKDVRTFLGGLDIMAVPSRFEGLGTVILDATGAGLPVCASETGGIPEIITHDKTGLLSAPDHAEDLATNLARLMEDPGLRARLAASARQHVEREFSVEKMVQGNAAVYREIMT